MTLFSFFSFDAILLPCSPKCLLLDRDDGREGELDSSPVEPLGTCSLAGGKEEFGKVFVCAPTSFFLLLISLPTLGFSVVEMDPCQVLQFRSRSMSSVFGGKAFPPCESLLPCSTLSFFWDGSALPDRGLDLGFALAKPSVMGSSSGALALLAVFWPALPWFRPLGFKFLNCWLLWDGRFSKGVAGFLPVRPLRP